MQSRLDYLPKSDLHLHTSFCGGADSPEEIVRTAIERGMVAVGFADHAGVSRPEPFGMRRDATRAYYEEIARLKSVYGEKIRILLGVEQDYYADDPPIGYDAVIGSVRVVRAPDGVFCRLDRPDEEIAAAVREHFRGDFYLLVKTYYETMADLLRKTGADLVAHFDFVTRFNLGGKYYDEGSIRYRKPALDALDALIERDPIFEICTGEIRVGYPLAEPAPWVLRRIFERGGRATLSSDAYRKEDLMTEYRRGLVYARVAGLGELEWMTRDGWVRRTT